MGSSKIRTDGSPRSAAAKPSRCNMPSENAPAFLLATSDRPTIANTWSIRFAGIRLLAAIQRRWFRAVRSGCTCLASNSAPTVRSG